MIKSLVLSAALVLPTSASALDPDKRLHLQGGALVSGITYAATGDPEKAILAAVIVGLGKELYDSTGRGNVEAGDVVATVIGGVLTVIFMDKPKKRTYNKPSSMDYHHWRTNK